MFFFYDCKADHNNKPEFKYKGPKEVEDLVVALYEYKAQRSDELDLAYGDEVLVLVRENENWWMGELTATRQQGYFPANYVQDKLAFNEDTFKKAYPNMQPPPSKFPHQSFTTNLI